MPKIFFALTVSFCAMLAMISCGEGTTDEETVAGESAEAVSATDELSSEASADDEVTDPVADDTAEGAGGGTATLTFGDERFEFELDQCEYSFGAFRAVGSADSEEGPLRFEVTYGPNPGGGIFTYGVELRKNAEDVTPLWNSSVWWKGEEFEDPETDLDEQIVVEDDRLESRTLVGAAGTFEGGVPGELVVVCD